MPMKALAAAIITFSLAMLTDHAQTKETSLAP